MIRKQTKPEKGKLIMTYSFTSFLNNNGANNVQGNAQQQQYNMRGASPKQVSYYMDLCKRKNVVPKDIASFTFETIGKEIEQLNKLPDPASPNQILKIKELEKEIIQNGGNLVPLTEDEMRQLSGGRNGTASEKIQELFNMRQTLSDVLPPTEQQLQILVSWYLCPDIPFESIQNDKFLPLEEGANEQKLVSEIITINKRVQLEGKQWRLMTPQEFANELNSKFTRKLASRFIDEHRGKFYAWKNTRATQGQIDYIRELEARLANIYTPRQVEYALVDGQQVQITQSSTRLDYAPTAYEGLNDMQIAQMSTDDASVWIDRLKSELDRGTYETMYNEEEVYGDSQVEFEESARYSKTQAEAYDKAYDGLVNIIFSLQAMVGYEAREVLDIVNSISMDAGNQTVVINNREKLKDFFMATVTADKERENEEWTKQMARIFNICEENEYAIEVLTGA